MRDFPPEITVNSRWMMQTVAKQIGKNSGVENSSRTPWPFEYPSKASCASNSNGLVFLGTNKSHEMELEGEGQRVDSRR